ncbi:MAG: sulfurtransferase [Pseudomonadales bacterium]|nr:sulfurtransferase [Pseudomonadales bacterium]
MYTTLINTSSLREHLADCLILDCRFNLADVGYGRRVYAEAHIPGAHYLHLDEDMSAPITRESGRHPLPDPVKWHKTLLACGMQPGRQVIAYDDAGGAMAARAWCLLRWIGHDAVAVLDGGFPAWLAADGEVSTAIPQRLELSDPGDAVHPLAEQLVSTADVMENLNKPIFTLVDARSRERYLGLSEPIDPVAGHIPGARNRPLTDNLRDGFFKTAKELRQEWNELLDGEPAASIVHMCGSGVTACHNQLAMSVAGLNGSRVYSGSWSEWIRDPQRPLAGSQD